MGKSASIIGFNNVTSYQMVSNCVLLLNLHARVIFDKARVIFDKTSTVITIQLLIIMFAVKQGALL